MLKIAITLPYAIDEEAAFIGQLLAEGIDIVHLRKPDAGIDYCRGLLKELTPDQRLRVVIHDYPTLYDEFSLRGVHLNRNVTQLPSDYRGSRTRSCHTFEEVVRHKEECDYLFLSPIFDSISKRGYCSKFSHTELLSASHAGIIDTRVIALGGVTPKRIDYLKSMNFGGIAMMGAISDILDKETQ